MRFDRFGIKASLLSLLVFGASTPASAETGLPYVFVPSTPALAEEVNANFRYVAPANVVYVRGDRSPAENGAALREAVKAENLQELAGAPSITRPYLVKLHPGTYQLNEPLVLGGHVHLVGSGRAATRIVTSSSTTGIQLRDGSVRELGLVLAPATTGLVKGIAVAISTLAYVSNVRIEGEGASLEGITASLPAGFQLMVENTEIRFTTDTEGRGLSISGSGIVDLENVDVTIIGAKRMAGISEVDSPTIQASDMRIYLWANLAAANQEWVWGIETRGSGEKRFANTVVFVRSLAKDVTLPILGSNANGGVLFFENGALTHSFTNHIFLKSVGGKGDFRIAGSRLSDSAYWVQSGTAKVKCVYSYLPDLTAIASCSDSPI